MRTLTSDMQAVLFAPNLQELQKSFNKKVYMIKRIVYDRMHDAIINCDASDKTKQELIAELHGLLHMQNSKAEKAPLQEIITIADYQKSEENLIKAVAKRCKEDPSFLARLGEKIV